MHPGPSLEPLQAADGEPSAVTRHHDTVLRPVQPWTPTINALLRHLEAVGFAGAPRVVADGDDGHGNQVLRYVEGELVHPHSWNDEAVWRVGRLLRQLHDATASFHPPADAVWQPWFCRSDAPGAVVGHGDSGPWHVVVRDGLPVAFIDWELAGPIDRMDEVAATAWWNAQLHDDDVAERNQLPDAPGRAAQLRLFLDGYGLGAAERAGLVSRMVEFAIRDCAWEATRAQVTPASTDATPLWALAWRPAPRRGCCATGRCSSTPSSPDHTRPSSPAELTEGRRPGRVGIITAWPMSACSEIRCDTARRDDP
jgi:hypothetical protein